MGKLPLRTEHLVLDVSDILDELMQHEVEPAIVANALARVSYRIIELRRRLALDLRSRGYSWAQVGAVFGMTKQGARAAWSGTAAAVGLDGLQGDDEVEGQLELTGR